MNQLKIIITFIFSFSVTLVFSQNEDWRKSFFERTIKRMPFIIDGTVIDAKSYKTEENQIVSSNLVRINKIFYRSDTVLEYINCGRVEVITKGGEVDGDISVAMHGRSGPLSIDLRAVFLLYPSDIKGIREGLENELDLRLSGSSGMTINPNHEENGLPASGGLFQRFDSIDAMYRKIESFGHTRLECPQKPEKNKE
jgi:hypothetical protein